MTTLRTADTDLFDELDRVSAMRRKVSDRLNTIVSLLAQGEREGQFASGQFGWKDDIESLSSVSRNLARGTFKLMVMGDMKRGKSTFVNALLGTNLLPTDISPCTAVLSVLKYGSRKQVTIHHSNGKPPVNVDFAHFKQDYTIDPSEAKTLEANGQQAFPHVKYAEIEYPLPLLKQGVEIVDTPGLNDTEARNRMVLDTLSSSHAVLFVLSATQPWTLDERRYVTNNLKDRGSSLFFAINGWDRLREGLADPDDTRELEAAEAKIRQVFETQFASFEFLQTRDRVFEVSALNALRQRIRDPDGDLQGTGFPSMLVALGNFLTRDRFSIECQGAIRSVKNVCDRVFKAVGRRIPLLDDDVAALTHKIDSVQAEFGTLESLRDRVRQLIQATGETEANKLADSFKAFILDLDRTFEADFLASQPNVGFLDFLNRNKRDEFSRAFQEAFERYMRDRISEWEAQAKPKLKESFTQLNHNLEVEEAAYARTVEIINRKLLQGRVHVTDTTSSDSTYQVWFDRIPAKFQEVPGNLNGAFTSFNELWQGVIQFVVGSLCLLIVVQIGGVIFSGLLLNIIGAIALGGGALTAHTELLRQQFLNVTRREFTKCLPEIAEEQWSHVYQAVAKCFKDYEQRIGDGITADIHARKAELSALLEQKNDREVDRVRETERLKTLVTCLKEEVDALESLEIVPP